MEGHEHHHDDHDEEDPIMKAEREFFEMIKKVRLANVIKSGQTYYLNGFKCSRSKRRGLSRGRAGRT